MKKNGKKGLSSALNLDSAVDSAFAKLSKKEMGRAIGGNPDSTDRKNIRIWLDMYNKAYPGRLDRMVKDVVLEVEQSDMNKHAELSADSALRKAFWLPNDLQEVFERAYPSLIKLGRTTANW